MARKAAYDREAVLAKAMRLFWAQGYQGTSLKDLETALDLRPGSIYSGFGSKQALFEAALGVYATASRSALAEAMSEAETPLAGLAGYVRTLGCFPAEAPSRTCMIMKTVLETPDDDPVLRPRAEALMRETERRFADAFRAAQSAGVLRPDADPERLATRLQAEILGLRAYAQRSDSADRIAALADDIARDLEALDARGG